MNFLIPICRLFSFFLLFVVFTRYLHVECFFAIMGTFLCLPVKYVGTSLRASLGYIRMPFTPLENNSLCGLKYSFVFVLKSKIF